MKLSYFSTATGSAVDHAAGMLRGVSVITEGEAKGHGLQIDAKTLEQVKACAETYSDGLRVKMDHYTGIDAMVGVLKNFAIDGAQLRADMHLLKSHSDFAKIMEMAETMPGAFGLSIAFSGAPEGGDDGTTRFARCTEIYSCDIVDIPAANPTGLFSEPMKTAPEINPEDEALATVTITVTTPEDAADEAAEAAEEEAEETAEAEAAESPEEQAKEEADGTEQPVTEMPDAEIPAEDATEDPATEDPAAEDPASEDHASEDDKKKVSASSKIAQINLIEDLAAAPAAPVPAAKTSPAKTPAPKAPEPEPEVETKAPALDAIVSDVARFAAAQNVLTAELATVRADIETKETVIASLSAKLADQTTELSIARADLAAYDQKHTQLNALHASLKKVLGLMPATNIPDAAVIDQARTPEDYRKEYAAISDPSARAEFYKANESQMFGI